MKKLFVIFAAFVAVTFAACGNATQAGGVNDTDSVVVDSVVDALVVDSVPVDTVLAE